MGVESCGQLRYRPSHGVRAQTVRDGSTRINPKGTEPSDYGVLTKIMREMEYESAADGPKKQESVHMPRVPPNFRRSDLQRAIRGAREEGFAIERIEVAKDGGFTLHPKLEIANVEDAAKQAWTRATEELQTKPKTKQVSGKSETDRKGKQVR
jgi:hypothetical protein